MRENYQMDIKNILITYSWIVPIFVIIICFLTIYIITYTEPENREMNVIDDIIFELNKIIMLNLDRSVIINFVEILIIIILLIIFHPDYYSLPWFIIPVILVISLIIFLILLMMKIRNSFQKKSK
jgi:hypothetical protein